MLIGAPTSAREPNTSAKPFPLCDGELTRLRGIQALKPEKAGAGLPDWDHAIVVAISLRARAELLGSNLLAPDDAARVTARAREATDIVLADEAQAPRIAAAAGASLGGARGWGTAKPLHIGPIEAIRVVDAYSTSMVLSCLTAWLEVAAARDPGYARQQLAALFPVLDHWLAARSFVPPGGGLSFEKIALAGIGEGGSPERGPPPGSKRTCGQASSTGNKTASC